MARDLMDPGVPRLHCDVDNLKLVYKDGLHGTDIADDGSVVEAQGVGANACC